MQPGALSNARALAIVTHADVVRQPNGSPQRTVFNWWRLTQFNAVADGLAQFTPAARSRLERAGYSEFVSRVLQPWLRYGKPTVQRVDFDGPDRAIVYMQTEFNVAVGPDLVQHNDDVLAMALQRLGKKWFISDPAWVISRARTLGDQVLAAQRRAQQRGS